MQISELEQAIHYKGTHKGVSFEIVRWELERGDFPAMNEGRGCWNYYVFVAEWKTENFESLWLHSTIKEFSPGGTKWEDFDYYASPLSVGSWHGGITFWEQGGLPGQRYIKIGCDFNHYWDMEREYSLENVLVECLETIEEILPLLEFKPGK